MFRRSATVVTLCRRRRHLAGIDVIGRCFARGWYHAGSWVRSCGDMRIAARFTLYFRAVFNILIMLLFSVSSLTPRVGASHDCRKEFIRAKRDIPGGAALLMIKSVIVAHVCRLGLKSRYVFSHVISIASFLDCMFRRSSPPSLVGMFRKSRAILGEESSSHIKSRIILVRADSIAVGIPWAFVRNWVRPPMIACIMIFLPCRVGLFLFHLCRSFLIWSNIGSHGAMSFVLLPIQAPRERIASPSTAIWMHASSGSKS